MAKRRPRGRSRWRPRADIISCSAARPAPARRCSRAASRGSCRRSSLVRLSTWPRSAASSASCRATGRWNGRARFVPRITACPPPGSSAVGVGWRYRARSAGPTMESFSWTSWQSSRLRSSRHSANPSSQAGSRSPAPAARSLTPRACATWRRLDRLPDGRSNGGRLSGACRRAPSTGPGVWRAPRPTSTARRVSTSTTSWKRSASACKMSQPNLPELRVRGRWPSPEGPRAAIVGSRRPSPYGEAVAEQLALDLARAGVVVVSGLALGLHAAAHRGALNAGGVTVAVMGTGVDVIYPSAHSVLAEAIVSGGGALVSQFADGTAPRRHNFPARNYTMAAPADVVVVVEAGEASGALITAEAALDLHKEVMAVPGSVFSPLSVGTHGLIRDGARLVQNARDVLAALP